ncbi:uncharacterized protein B0T23DRAFT_241777 [Neurospora hispaniola]|uniref:Uncharacterized protein n=1 Tax=Neurospora hispaniola TaxID=588809 RepID=A0AAJ0HZY2_9PEZI|nr:hypothetical protein B0T23DRAFT_241777 [Neurospora hispaniola]
MVTLIGQAGAWVGSRIRQYSNLKGSGIQDKSAKEHISFFLCYCCLFAVSFSSLLLLLLHHSCPSPDLWSEHFPQKTFLLAMSSLISFLTVFIFFFPFPCRDIKKGVGLKAENGKNMEGKDKGQGSRVTTGSLAYEISRGICKGYPVHFFFLFLSSFCFLCFYYL